MSFSTDSISSGAGQTKHCDSTAATAESAPPAATAGTSTQELSATTATGTETEASKPTQTTNPFTQSKQTQAEGETKPPNSGDKPSEADLVRIGLQHIAALDREYGVIQAATDGNHPIELDAAILEGGGQCVRNSLALAALLGQSIVLRRIRAGRPRGGGLHPQHLTGVLLLQQLAGGTMQHAKVRSQQLIYEPQQVNTNRDVQATAESGLVDGRMRYIANTKTAGSVCLLAQIALPVLLFLPWPTSVTLLGGTAAKMAPTSLYLERVLLPTLQRVLGVTASASTSVHGLYKRGGGVCQVDFEPQQHGTTLPCFRMMERGALTRIHALLICFSSTTGNRAFQQQSASAARSNLNKWRIQVGTALHRIPAFVESNIQLQCEGRHQVAADEGALIMLTAYSSNDGIFSVCRIRESANKTNNANTSLNASMLSDADDEMSVLTKLSEECIDHLHQTVLQHPTVCVDEYLQDQLIVFMTLAQGESSIRCASPLTLHTVTAIHWAHVLTRAKFRVSPADEAGSCVVTCEGIGYKSRFITQ